MARIPEIRPVFYLTKNTTEDFDREAVTRRLSIEPTKTLGLRLSPGRAASMDGFEDMEGMTVLPGDAPPYPILLHACWGVRLEKMPCWALDEPLRRMEELLRGREEEMRSICREMDLHAALTLAIHADSGNLPEMVLPRESVAFWASIGAEIDFDFYLD